MNTPTPRTDALYFQRGNWANEEELRDLARKLERELASERARLDWLDVHGYLLDQITHGASKPHPDDYWICTDGERTGEGATPRAAIDAAMNP
tara:strand:- start:129 stop:407 length:279 start_codon:yes stop_codon:yes gene_type:complete